MSSALCCCLQQLQPTEDGAPVLCRVAQERERRILFDHAMLQGNNNADQGKRKTRAPREYPLQQCVDTAKEAAAVLLELAPGGKIGVFSPRTNGKLKRTPDLRAKFHPEWQSGHRHGSVARSSKATNGVSRASLPFHAL